MGFTWQVFSGSITEAACGPESHHVQAELEVRGLVAAPPCQAGRPGQPLGDTVRARGPRGVSRFPPSVKTLLDAPILHFGFPLLVSRKVSVVQIAGCKDIGVKMFSKFSNFLKYGCYWRNDHSVYQKRNGARILEHSTKPGHAAGVGSAACTSAQGGKAGVG